MCTVPFVELPFVCVACSLCMLVQQEHDLKYRTLTCWYTPSTDAQPLSSLSSTSGNVPTPTMLSPARITLQTPSSPFERQTFRSRSLRRFVTASCCLLLIYVTLHTVSLQSELQQSLTGRHPTLSSSEGRGWFPLAHRVEHSQYTFRTFDKKAGDRPATVEEQIEQLPEVVRIPFEEAIADVVLQGWEDEWFSSATFNYGRFGPLSEPKIDFVYNCECEPVRLRQMC